MKKWIIALSICTLLVCSTLTILVTASEPTVLLPSGEVNINAEYGDNSWFEFTLSSVPSDYYDVKNGTYSGWCVDKDLEMTRSVNHQVILKSSLETNIGNGYDEIDWNEINYIINHDDNEKYSRNDIQMAIWYFTDGVSLSGYDDAQELVTAATQSGSTFIPQSDEWLAIPIIAAVDWIQPAFLELKIPSPSLLGFVWYDTNTNGVQDAGEPGLGGISVGLFNSTNISKANTQTNSEGIYSFGTFEPGSYYLKFTLKSGHKFTTKDNGDDTLDSDADITTGKTILFDIPVNQEVSITNWDAGMYKQSSGGTTEPPEEKPIINKPPTADGTAGEPYRGYINGPILFNGSRSYDSDGQIITWRWNFGDGNGTGEITTHVYTLPGNYTVTLLVTDNKGAQDIFTTNARITLGNNPPQSAPVVSGPLSGNTNVMYQYTVVLTDPDGDNLLYYIDWGDGEQDTSPSISSGDSFQTAHQWNAAGLYEIQVYAKDIPIIFNATYNATSPTNTMTIAIDVRYVNTLGYLIDENGDGIFDQFHNNATGIEKVVKQQTNGKYLIDSNGDGTYDLTYDTTTGQTEKYSEQPLLEYIIIILVILVIASLLIFYLLRKRKQP